MPSIPGSPQLGCDAQRWRAHRVGLIGYGAIGRAVAAALLAEAAPGVELAAVLDCDEAARCAADEALGAGSVVVTASPERFLACELDLVVEVAGQEAVRQLAAPALELGRDVLVVSTGAFTDDALFARLSELAARGEGHLFLAAGALPAVDWMQAAALAPVHDVTISQTKPVRSWLGTQAESLIDLAALSVPTCFFEAVAREAARCFPKSSNITATLALATVGLDRTRVRLVADPTCERMHTRIDFTGEAGAVAVEWEGVPSATNPSTSADVPLAVLKAIRNWASGVVIGA
jgi:aspartate dehydrogenase